MSRYVAKARKVACPMCGKVLAVTPAGAIRMHDSRDSWKYCAGSGQRAPAQTPQEDS